MEARVRQRRVWRAAASRPSRALLLPAAALVGLALHGCGDDVAQPEEGAPDAAVRVAVAAEGTPPPRAPALPAPGAAEPGGGAPPAFFPEAAAGDMPSLTAPARACAGSLFEAETIERVVEVPVEEQVVVPTVFYLMLDSSGSMVDDPFTLAGLIEDILDLFGLGQTPPQPTKWDYAVAGLERFMRDPASAGIELALGYFPDGGQCDGSGYDVPAVALGPLPENAAALESSLEARVPAGGTPLEGALRGATDHCLAVNAERPDRSCVAVLITDGAAEECSARSAAELANIASAAAERGVLTYAAGMQGADFGVLDAIGQAGGGDCDPGTPAYACDLTADREAFAAALAGIRDRTRTRTRIETRIERERVTVPCEWPLPAPPAGQDLDPTRVNVELASATAEPATLANVPGAPECGSAGGWYYDDPEQPSTIKACPATCAALDRDPDLRVQLLLGCATLIR